MDHGTSPSSGDSCREIRALRTVLAEERQTLEAERRSARRWKREAVLRASTVAGSLTAEIMAAQRLAATIERYLDGEGKATTGELADIRAALRFFNEVHPRSEAP